MSNESKDILEGYNAGYIIKQKTPELFKQLQESLKDVDLPFFNAFEEGGKEYTQEKIRELVRKDSKPNINEELKLSKENPDKDEPEIDMDI